MKHSKPRILRNRARKSPKQVLGHAAKEFTRAAEKGAMAVEAFRTLSNAGTVLIDKLQSLSFAAGGGGGGVKTHRNEFY